MPAKLSVSFGVPPKVKTDVGFVERARVTSLEAHVLNSKAEVIARLQSVVTDAPRTAAQNLEVPRGDYVVSVRLFTQDDAVITRSFKLVVDADLTLTLDLD